MLSPREQEQLAGIEQDLEQSDPAFARALRDGDDAAPRGRWNRMGTRAALYAAGLALCVVSAATESPWLFLVSIILVAIAVGMRVHLTWPRL